MLSNAFILIFPARFIALFGAPLYSNTVFVLQAVRFPHLVEGGVDTQRKLCDSALLFDLAFWHTYRISVIQLGKTPFLLCIIIRATYQFVIMCHYSRSYVCFDGVRCVPRCFE